MPEPFLSIDMPGATLRLASRFLSAEVADSFLERLLEEIRWREEVIRVWGKWHRQPRLIAWHGDEGAAYTYSGRTLTPLPWTPTLEELRRKVELASGARYNSVLLNQYRDNRDSMGWHADDEPELGDTPTIASLSLGESRDFLFRHRLDKSLGKRHILLEHGSLLVMSGETQQNWLHAIAKERQPCGPRINLTFRLIVSTRQT